MSPCLVPVLCASALLFPFRDALAQTSNPKVDSLLRVADSLRIPGPRSGPDSALARLRLAAVLESSARIHAAIADAFMGVYAARRAERSAYDSALLHANEALRLDPRNVRALFSRGAAHSLAGRRTAVLADYEQVLALDSTHARVAPLLITEYYDAGRTREAVALGERLRVLQPRNFFAQFRLGWAYGYLWDQEKAQQVFNRMAEDSTAGRYRALGHGELAYLARARGDIPGAVSHMEQAERAAPADRLIQLGLATMLLTAGDAVRARPIVEAVLASDSNAVGFGAIPGRLLLGWAARDLGDTTLARRMFADVERTVMTSSGTGNEQRPMLLKVYGLQSRRADAIALLRNLPQLPRDNLYGGPDDHDITLMSLRGIPEFDALVSKERGRTNARRRVMQLPPKSSSADANSIRDARLAQNTAIAAGDLEKIASYWTEDVTIRRGLGQIVSGRRAYRRLFAVTSPRDSTLVYQRQPDSIEVSPQWPLAYEAGTWSGHLGHVAGPTVIQGRYAAQWVRRDHRWLIRSEVFVALSCAGMGCTYMAAP